MFKNETITGTMQMKMKIREAEHAAEHFWLFALHVLILILAFAFSTRYRILASQLASTRSR